MDITFLVGNGFDISAGLKTSYEDFYRWYCDESNSLDDSDNIKMLKQDILERRGEYWSDFECGLGQYTKKFTYDEAEEYIECYEDAHGKMNEYIKQVEGQYDKSVVTDSALDVFRQSIKNYYRKLTPKEVKTFDDLMESDKTRSSTIHFISFNYTNLLDLYINRLAAGRPLNYWNVSNSEKRFTVSPEVLHIHGKVNNYPILGVSEKEYVANPKLLQNARINTSLIKQNSVDSLGQYWYEEAENQINGSEIICIFGMSIGESDSLWWGKIMEWLDSNPNRQLILYCYNSPSEEKISPGKRFENVEKVKEKLTDYSAFTSDHIKTINERIHVADSGNTLVVQPVDKPPSDKVYDGS